LQLCRSRQELRQRREIGQQPKAVRKQRSQLNIARPVIIGSQTLTPRMANFGPLIVRHAGKQPVRVALMMRTGKMRLLPSTAILVLVTVLGGTSSTLAAGDATAGQTVFNSRCATCHTTEPGVNKIGPSLAGIVGSKSGTVPGFNFSTGMKSADITWDDAELDKFLANPAGDVHGTKMFINLPSESDRQNVIAYLHTLKK
jgi:cytochrome c